MKKLLAAMFVALLMVGCGGDEVDGDKIQVRGGVAYLPNEDTAFTGLGVKKYDNGQTQAKTHYQDGKKDGLSTEWYENGQKESEMNWTGGKEDGVWTSWYSNGQMYEKTTYRDGKKEGPQTRWHDNGQKDDASVYNDSKLWSAKRWKPNGEVCPFTSVVDGRGVVIDYNSDGSVFFLNAYGEGVRNGPNIFFSNGSMVSAIIYKNDKKVEGLGWAESLQLAKKMVLELDADRQMQQLIP